MEDSNLLQRRGLLSTAESPVPLPDSFGFRSAVNTHQGIDENNSLFLRLISSSEDLFDSLRIDDEDGYHYGRRSFESSRLNFQSGMPKNPNLSASVRRNSAGMAAGPPLHNGTANPDNSEMAGSSIDIYDSSPTSVPLYYPPGPLLGHSNGISQDIPRSDVLDARSLSAIRTGLETLDTENSHMPLLDDYRLADTQVICFRAKDRYGSRFLIERLLSGSKLEVEMIMEGTILNIFELMEDPYGNDVVRNMFEVCSEYQVMRTIHTLAKAPVHLVGTCTNQYGSKTVQRLIERFKNFPEIEMIPAALNTGFTTLISDKYGHAVLNRCLEQLRIEENMSLVRTADRLCLEIATQRYGCIFLNSCIKSLMENECGVVNSFIEMITTRGLQLAKHVYGNYVIQQIIDLKSPVADQILMSQFEGHFEDLSTRKTGAYVVEKCIQSWSNRNMIVYELLSTPHFDLLMQDQFANYVLNTALIFCKGRVHDALVRAIILYKEGLRNNPYCKRMILKACHELGF